MRILHVIETLAPSYGGPVSIVRQLVRSEHRLGMQVEIATTNSNYPSGTYCHAGTRALDSGCDVLVHYLAVGLNPIRYSRTFARFIKASIKKYNIIYIHGLYRFPTTYAAFQARKQHIPYIIRPQGSLDPYLYRQSSRSLLLKRLYERFFDWPNLRGASAIHYVSDMERERAASLGFVTSTIVEPNGLDWELYSTLPDRGAFRAALGVGEVSLVLFLGRLNFKKGLDLLIPAFARVRNRHPDAHLAIVGPDNDGYGAKVRGWVTDHGLNERVHFVDQLHDADVIQAYVDADVFVLPSYTENFGMTVVEAMACKLPVVISDQVNIHNEVTESDGGLVTHCDVDEVAKGISGLLGDADKRRSMGESGRRYVEEHYSWTVIVGGLIQEYETIVARANKDEK